ncbi:MAG: carboxypeptidase-like regulatory domain-containing protein [Bacteroidetes bacterium]|nr:MAG: carboxypeptidase-like regulatory domain-containing protein [Bacteroidota bacterium]
MKTNRIILSVLLLLFIFPANSVSGQTADDYYFIRGTVRDAKSNKPLPHASVFVSGTYIGTVANINGYFSLRVRKSDNLETFRVSYLGYAPRELSFEDYSGKESDFLMNVHSLPLQEVIIRPVNARELVINALDKVDENYPQEEFMLTGFYREAIKQRNDYISIAEAVVDIRKESYGSYSKNDQVQLVKGRKSADVVKADTLLVKLQGGPQVALLVDFIKNNNMVIGQEIIDFYDYELMDLVVIDGKTHYVIGFTPRLIMPYPLFMGNIYIDNESLAITMADFSMDLSDKNKASMQFIQKKPARLRFTPTHTRYQVKFQEIDGKNYLSYVRGDLEFYANWRRKIFRTKYALMFEMAIMDRSNQELRTFTRRESFGSRSILADLVSEYFTDDFWGGYNIIEPEIDIEEAVKKLNQKLSETE